MGTGEVPKFELMTIGTGATQAVKIGRPLCVGGACSLHPCFRVRESGRSRIGHRGDKHRPLTKPEVDLSGEAEH